MTVQILFQMVGYRNFKTFYTGFLQQYWSYHLINGRAENLTIRGENNGSDPCH